MCTVVVGDVENYQQDKKARKMEEMEKDKDIFSKVNDESNWEEKIEEVHKVGLYKRGE